MSDPSCGDPEPGALPLRLRIGAAAAEARTEDFSKQRWKRRKLTTILLPAARRAADAKEDVR
ncbi:MAG TPA: hypothetical protein VKB34_07105 [Povalibacter sp.]|nr:hypothetical protein [Povalibacter sp.]